MSDIRQWLDLHGLSKYAEVFAENDVDLGVLPHLTEEHLEKLDVSLGHRVKMLKAIEKLATQAAAQAESAGAARHEAAPSGEAERLLLALICKTPREQTLPMRGHHLELERGSLLV